MVHKQTPSAESKKADLCNKLRRLALEKGPEAQLPTFRTLCAELETSRVTLGEVLEQLEAEGVIYRKERQGIFVSPHIHRKSIVILFNSNEFLGSTISPFWGMLWLRFEQEIQRRKQTRNEQCVISLVQTPIMSNQPLPEAILEVLQNRQHHGILSVGVNIPGEQVRTHEFVPTVVFAAEGYWLVVMDGEKSGRWAVQTLAQQHCKRIGFWMPSHEHLHLEQRNEFNGVTKALSEHKLPYHPELMRQFHKPPSLSSDPLTIQEQGYLLAREVFSVFNKNKPDGLFICDDLMTDGALIALEELGIQVGKDIKIVTYANVGSPTLFGRTKNMTIFEFDPNNIVQAMFAQLDQLIAHQEPAERVIWISPKLRQ